MNISAPVSETADSQRGLHLSVSFFCSIIPFFSLAAFTAMRAGLQNDHLPACLKLLGISLFLLFATDILNRVLRLAGKEHLQSRWYLSESIIPAYALLLLCGAGYLARFTSISFYIIPAILGYLFWLFSSVIFIRRSGIVYLLVGIVLTAFFCFWVTALTVRPAMLESVVAGNTHIDFWFHTSMSQMIKTYGIPSSGFDGTPWMYYHYGSHVLIASLSGLLSIPVHLMYSVGYAMVLVPLFFKMYLTFAFTVRNLVTKSADLPSPQRIDYLTAFMFLCIFLQVIKNLYTGLFLGYNFLGGESYTTGLTFLFVICSTSLLFWHEKQKSSISRFLFFFLFLPAAFTVLGFLKISMLYLALVIAGYLFLRLKLFRHLQNWLVAAILVVIGIYVYMATVETISFGSRQIGYEGKVELFYFFRETHPFEPVNFFVFFYLWSYLFIVVFFLTGPVRNFRQLVRSFRLSRTVSVELVILICLAGILPAFFLMLTGGNAMYFSGFQALFSSALIIAFLPLIKIKWSSLTQSGRLPAVFYQILTVLLSVAVYLILYMNVRFKVTEELGRDFNIRKTILRDTSDEKFDLTGAVSLIASRTLSPNQEKFRYLYSSAAQEALEKDTVYQFLKKLQALDQMRVPDKKNFSVYTDFQRAGLPFKVPCYIVPFLVPGLSGMASVYGMPYNCPMGAYGYEYYKNHPGQDHTFTPQEVCTLARDKGFRNIIWYQPAGIGYKPVTCR